MVRAPSGRNCPSEVTDEHLDVRDRIALGRPNLFAIGNRIRDPDCSVETKVKSVMAEMLAEAEEFVWRDPGR